MKAVMLAAGKGTRLAFVDPAVPKVLTRPVPSARTLLEHQLAYLERAGVTDVAVNLHHYADLVAEALDAYSGPLRIVTSHEAALLGTAGALRPLRDFLDQTFVVLYGDVVTDLDLRPVVEAHDARGGIATITYYRSPDVAGKGVLHVDTEGRISAFVEKANEIEPGLINAGIYALEPEVLDYVEDVPSDFGFDVWPRALAAGKPMYGYDIGDAYLLDMGTPLALSRLRDDCEHGVVQW